MTQKNSKHCLKRPSLHDSLRKTVLSACGITLDIARQRMTQEDLEGLYAFAEEKGVMQACKDQREGKIINVSEGRAALHTTLRDPRVGAPFHKEVAAALEHQCDFADAVRSGLWTGCRGDTITDVINVGIGGSEMGPHAVYHALRAEQPPVRLHFLAGADGIAFDRIISGLNPFRTLIVVSSKSFKTRETVVNAAAVDQWLLEAGISGEDRNRHMVVVSANPKAAREMNLPDENLFPIWQWVGGRFSVWSSIGLPVAIAIGSNAFREFLSGAHGMDLHVEKCDPRQNLPLTLALLEYWNTTKFEMGSHCLLPYDERLRHMVPWLQQLEMESLGKLCDPHGNSITGPTGPGIWGSHGNEGQHSFYQWLREGSSRTAIDLMWCEKPGHKHAELHRVLIANAKAQAEALITRDNDELFYNGVTTVILSELTPARLGALMAMYEYKTTMLGTLYGINPFDQPGVEYGKKLSLSAEKDFL